MTYDFDRLIDRRRSDSSKWQKYGPDVLPLWVADMDFQSPEPVIRALRERVEHGVYGYITFEQPEFHQLFADRLLKRYGWRAFPRRLARLAGRGGDHPRRHPGLQRGRAHPREAG